MELPNRDDGLTGCGNNQVQGIEQRPNAQGLLRIINHYCCVPRCSSWNKRDPQLTFHIFLAQGKHQVSLINKFGQKERIDRRKAWILNLRIGKPVSKIMRVCSLHFAEEDYFYRSKDSKKAEHTEKNCSIFKFMKS
ncbi:hypothetical protein NQ318_010728 [Aromia moschata]|uniref:THAP-type domain-containing protein n=1 Tax=Aromia moschata TaxID=1265417 RepID=A0AAV8YM82_9CUCU|nr:hypothetical protein NQ318_010728 [Aromia moschata]